MYNRLYLTDEPRWFLLAPAEYCPNTGTMYYGIYLSLSHLPLIVLR